MKNVKNKKKEKSKQEGEEKEGIIINERLLVEGGAVMIDSTSFTDSGSRYEFNSISSYGGAVRLSHPLSSSFHHSLFIGNTAASGAALSAWDSSLIEVLSLLSLPSLFLSLSLSPLFLSSLFPPLIPLSFLFWLL